MYYIGLDVHKKTISYYVPRAYTKWPLSPWLTAELAINWRAEAELLLKRTIDSQTRPRAKADQKGNLETYGSRDG
jgi:hypothetical protein